MKFSLTAVVSLLSFGAAVQAFNSAALRAFDRGNHARSNLEARHPALPEKRHLVTRQSKFSNANTEKFAVNGSAIPEVDFDIGESYAGLLPISTSPDETRELYFWFFPTTNPEAGDEIVIWLNGGPGCSSLSGLLTENGPFLWQEGTLSPVPNSYSWTNLTNVVWVEQPVGVGYSQGVPNITNEVELGEEFAGFWYNFIETFGMQGFSTYITGESYAGYYTPYIADAILTAGETDPDHFKLGGVAINDPILGDGTIQQQVVILPFVEYWHDLIYLNDSFMAALQGTQDYCNYSSYLDKYFTFPPPPGPFPVLPDPYSDPSENYTCDMFDIVYYEWALVNPCFNIYHITDTCPKPFSQLGIVNTGDYQPPGAQVYFNRSDVQAAINAPAGTNWAQCTPTNVFGGATDNQSLSDTSLGPAQNGVLQRVIEATNNTIIGVGRLDFILPPNGTLFALQNVTWNGAQGFQKYPQDQEFFVPFHPEYNGGRQSEAGVVGQWGQERGLIYYEVQLGGHELPGYSAGSGYRVLEVLLGRVEGLGTVGDFSTQMGEFGNNASMLAL